MPAPGATATNIGAAIVRRALEELTNALSCLPYRVRLLLLTYPRFSFFIYSRVAIAFV